MKSLEIRAAMILAGVTNAEIGRKLGVRGEFVSQVVHGRRRTRYVQEAIAAAIDRRPEDVFSDYPSTKMAATA